MRNKSISKRTAREECSDEILIRAFVTNKDEQSFVMLIERYTDRIRGLLYTLLNGSIEDIYDVEQEVVISLFRSLRNFGFRSHFSTYLYRVCTNVAINYLRTVKRGQQVTERLQVLSDSSESESEGAQHTLEQQEGLQQLNQAFKKLNTQDKTIIHLRVFEERSVRECATILGIREGSVKSRLNRARGRLSILLQGEKNGCQR